MENKWYLKVPKILHVYWGGGVLPYLRYMTVKSFKDLNPDWDVMFWYPKTHTHVYTWATIEQKYDVLCTDYMPTLLNMPITKREVDFNDIGFPNDISETHKADFMRNYLLSTYGGVWSDMDVLFFKPITRLEVNIPENEDKEAFVCICAYGHSTGFNMATKGTAFFKKLFESSKGEYNSSLYQCLGPEIYNKYGKDIKTINKMSPAVNMKMDILYANDAHGMTDILSGAAPRFTEGSIGIHWYAGHPMWGKFFKETDGGLINLPDNIIGNLLRK